MENKVWPAKGVSTKRKISFMGRLLNAAQDFTPMRNVYEDILIRWMVRIYKARLYSNPGSPDFYYLAFFGRSSAITLPS